jgi:hypothetical protein
VNKVSKTSWRKAEEFLRTQARPFEQALFAAAFQGGQVQWALHELAAFQNSDGGFGRGLEPDCQLPDSSILATTVALQHLRALQAPATHPLVKGAMRYLMDTFDSAARAWQFVPPAVVNFPRAPWWEYDADLTRYLANPRAEIVGYLFDYAQLCPADLRHDLLATTIDYLANLNGSLKMHELLCYARLVETRNLPEPARQRLLEMLQPTIAAEVKTNPLEWDSYVLKPLGLAPSPDSCFAPAMQEFIDANLNYEIEQQQEDGSWHPAWTWGNAYPEAWPHAKRAWQGVITVHTMQSLAEYGRVES